MSAVILVENAILSSGRLIVIPDINMSASTWTESTIVPSWIRIDSPHGARFFKYGARYTDPVHQGMTDPDRYKHPKEAILSMDLRLAISTVSILANLTAL